MDLKYRDILARALERNLLFRESADNISAFLDASEYLSEAESASLKELLEKGDFEELNDRFFKEISFGTGGIRGKSVSKNPTLAEWPDKSRRPQNPALGTNRLNDIVVLKSTLGLWNYSQAAGLRGAPSLVVAYDVRVFSERFARLAAGLWSAKGGRAHIFGAPCATPLLSYAVRDLGADYGVVITASHNPYPDNGYKVYSGGGNQITSEAAKAIFSEIKKIGLAEIMEFRGADLSAVQKVPESVEKNYIDSLANSVLDFGCLKKRAPKIAYTPLHGTGAVLCPKIAERFGLDVEFVGEQMRMDWSFSTVKSPNPEEPGAMDLGLKKAREVSADALVATDPDSDRIGLAAKDSKGGYTVFTGNQTAAMLAEYRVEKLSRLGLIKNPSKCAVIKSYITTPLVEKICAFYGVKCVNTLTGFKYIGEKLSEYEARAGGIREADYAKRALAFQEKSAFFILGAEESLGYLASDSNREKDAFSAMLAVADMLAHLKSQNKTPADFLNEIYLKYGYHFDGAAGVKLGTAEAVKKCGRFLDSLNEKPPREIAGERVERMLNFSNGGIFDADGRELPKEKFFIFYLENGARLGLRASGTEAKIKMYASICLKAGSRPGFEAEKKRSEELANRLFKGASQMLEDF